MVTRGESGARDPLRLPLVTPGLKVGLFGGSFNPAHEAHRDVSLLALKRLGLDRVWWLVSPGNPLKDNSRLPPLAVRVSQARQVADHPRIDVTGIEATLGTRYTFETVAALRARAPQVDFVWIMGADNLTGFHRWQKWRDLSRLLPLAVVDRMGDSLRATGSRAARTLARYRLDEGEARLLPRALPPAWVFLHGMKSPLSSTRIRSRAEAEGQEEREGTVKKP